MKIAVYAEQIVGIRVMAAVPKAGCVAVFTGASETPVIGSTLQLRTQLGGAAEDSIRVDITIPWNRSQGIFEFEAA